MKNKLAILLSTLSLLCWSQITPRHHYGALLEPHTGILSGAGQSHGAHKLFWDAMDATNKPTIYMYYINLERLTNTWYIDLKAKLQDYPNHYLIPQIGLSMSRGGGTPNNYEQEVADGDYDTQIGYLVEGLQQLDRPIFLRIGFEFNGLAWNGYQPESYVNAFRKITDNIKRENLEVATVWCYAADGIAEYETYYPGDSYVDWFAIDLFSDTHFSDPKTVSFTAYAHTQGKPLMIGESTPRYIGVNDGATSWEAWFNPYFNYIANNPGVKAWCYINWDWSRYPKWHDWGDARIEQNTYVKTQFNAAVAKPIYLHASNEKTFRELLHPSDNLAPTWTPNLTANTIDYPYQLSWDPATDASSIAYYAIYKNDIEIDRTPQTTWQNTLANAEETNTYHVKAVDRAGNETPYSNPVTVEHPDKLQKIRNASFTDAEDFWCLETYGIAAQAQFNITNSTGFPNENNAHITITSSPGTDWQIFFKQPIYLKQGHEYSFSFNVKGDVASNATFVVQHTTKKRVVMLWNNFSIDTKVNPITFNKTLTEESGLYNIAFALGTADTQNIWLDDITATDIGPKSLAVNKTSKLKIVPNPSKNKITVKGIDSGTAYVIYDIKGVLKYKGKLSNDGSIDISSLQTGMYILKISNKQGRFTKS